MAFEQLEDDDEVAALALFREVVVAAELAGDDQSIVSAALEAEHLEARAMRVEPAMELVEKARLAAVRLNDPMALALTANAMGEMLCHLGRPDEAVALHRSAVGLVDASAEPGAVAWFLANAAWALQEMGDFDDALALYEEAIAAQGTAIEGDDTVLLRATVLADLGRVEEARLVVNTAGDVSETPVGLRAAAHVHAREGDIARARELFATAVHELEDDGDLLEARCALREMARLGL